MKELRISRIKSALSKATTTRKNLRKDWPNSREESESSRSEVPARSKWARLKTESTMPFAQPEQPLPRE